MLKDSAKDVKLALDQPPSNSYDNDLVDTYTTPSFRDEILGKNSFHYGSSDSQAPLLTLGSAVSKDAYLRSPDLDETLNMRKRAISDISQSTAVYPQSCTRPKLGEITEYGSWTRSINSNAGYDEAQEVGDESHVSKFAGEVLSNVHTTALDQPPSEYVTGLFGGAGDWMGAELHDFNWDECIWRE